MPERIAEERKGQLCLDEDARSRCSSPLQGPLEDPRPCLLSFNLLDELAHAAGNGDDGQGLLPFQQQRAAASERQAP